MHKKIWFKIHWFLGITAGIILLIVGTSGAVLSFEKEILKAINKDSYIVPVPNSSKLSTKELLSKFKENFPHAKINRYTFSNDLDSSVAINVSDMGEGREAKKGINYFVNPYTAEVLPSLIGKDFFGFFFRLHRWIAFEGDFRKIGKQAVAISTISLIVLIISAIVIYWGRIKHSFFKSFTFKFKHKGRAFLSTIHSAIGMWVIPFYLLATLTGLFWSYDWYKDALYKISGVEKPQRFKPNNNEDGNKQSSKGEFTKKVQLGQNFNEFGNAVTLFKDIIKDEYSKANVNFPQSGTVYTFHYFDKDPAHYRAVNEIEIDVANKIVVKHERYNDKPLNERLMKSILPLHTGEYFGLIGQTGMFISGALMSLFTITGFMLYIQRKRKKKKIRE